jgi:hypothetical protein
MNSDRIEAIRGVVSDLQVVDGKEDFVIGAALKNAGGIAAAGLAVAGLAGAASAGLQSSWEPSGGREPDEVLRRVARRVDSVSSLGMRVPDTRFRRP